MADIDRRDRGQIILIAGFVLAVTFVALALILNSVIFTENLATRSESVGGAGPVDTRSMVVDSTGTLLAYVNAHNNTASGDPATAMADATNDLDRTMGPLFASTGSILDVTYVGETAGTRYAHNDTARPFRSSGSPGNADWTITTGVSDIRDFGLNVSRGSLADATNCPNGDCFRVNVTNGDVWGVAVYADGDDVVVESYDDTGTIGTCSAAGETVELNLTTGQVGGRNCPSLVFADGVSPPYDVNIENGDDAAGRYSLITTETGSLSSLLNFDAPGSTGSPRATHALYSATVRVEYVLAGVEYETEVRVAPGEPT